MNLISDFQIKIKTTLKELEKSKKIILPESLNGLSINIPPTGQKGDLACNVSMLLAKLNKKNNMMKSFELLL